MKRGYLYSTALTMLIAASCSVSELDMQIDDPIVLEPTAREIIITAGFDESGGTKTILNNEGKVEWLPSDEMCLFSAGEMAKFTSLNSESARSANFVGYIRFITGANEGSEPEAFVYGLYPYDADATMSAGVLTTTIPSSQVGYPDSFGDDLALSVAKSTSLNLNFKNAYSGIDFEFSETGYTSVTLSSNSGELIAGTVNVSFDGNGVPQTEVVSGSSSITVTAPGGGSFQIGKRYYIVCAPQTMEGGFTLTAHKSTGSCSFRVTSRQMFARNTFKYVTGNLNERGEFTPTPVIVFADNAVKTICVSNWDTNDDGELTYDEAASVTSLGTVFRNNTSIQSFNELVNFTGLTSINNTAFFNCTSLQEITLPTNITTLGNSAFNGCTSLSSVIHQGGFSIGYHAFSDCSNLSVFSFEGITALGEEAFANCTSLPSVITIPASVGSIYRTPFKGCTQITRFEGSHTDASGQLLFTLFESSFEDVANVVQVLPSIVNFTMPEGIYYLDCPLGDASARTITIPSTVIIGYGSVIEIPENVESLSIGDGFNFSSNCAFAPLPVGCEIYNEYATADHACLIRYNQLIAFSYPQDLWDNHQCYKLPGSITFSASVDLQANCDQSWDCWGLVIPSTVTFPEYGSDYRINGDGISYIFESSASATSVMNHNQQITGFDCRFIIPRSSYSGDLGGYYNDNARVMVCPFYGNLPNTGDQMQWWSVLDHYTSEFTDGYYIVI